MTDTLHVPWPKRPDGSNMSIGEMSPEDRKAQLRAAAERFKAKHAKDLPAAVELALLKRDML